LTPLISVRKTPSCFREPLTS